MAILCISSSLQWVTTTLLQMYNDLRSNFFLSAFFFCLFLAYFFNACMEIIMSTSSAYVREAQIWNTEGAPADVQMARVEKHEEKAVKEFTQYVFKMMGMRVYVLGVYRRKNGKIYTIDFDFNDQLSSGDKVEDKVVDWNTEEYLRLFKRYANTQFCHKNLTYF
ncbi:hypothetical protein AcV5_001763 [Taiwanofungus camphoratus]|nr:hypothetical protein AcV5_001763 [Antrodia cinnamomea]